MEQRVKGLVTDETIKAVIGVIAAYFAARATLAAMRQPWNVPAAPKAWNLVMRACQSVATAAGRAAMYAEVRYRQELEQ